MIDLTIDEVYDSNGNITPMVVLLYASFLEGMRGAGLITQETKDAIIKEVMEKGYIKLPDIEKVTIYLNSLGSRITAASA